MPVVNAGSRYPVAILRDSEPSPSPRLWYFILDSAEFLVDSWASIFSS